MGWEKSQTVSVRLSVIIPTLNEPTLRDTLDAISRQTLVPHEIIVVGRDEAGITGSYPQVRFIDTQVPVCAAAARNRGFLASSGDVLAFTDSDCIPAPDWLQQHVDAQLSGSEVVGGGVQLSGDNYLAQADNVSMFHQFIAAHAPGTRKILATLNLSVRRELVQRIGPLDESFPGAAGEDTDWTIRMRREGAILSFVPGARVVHRPSRIRWAHLVRHWRNSGASGIRVRRRYPDEYRASQFFSSPLLVRISSPVIALWVTLRIYCKPQLWRYVRYAPVVYLTKIVYCLGVADSLETGFAFSDNFAVSQEWEKS